VHPFFSIGHSTRTIQEFVALLRSSEVGLVADVRAIPRSRTNPQYNAEVLPASLASFEIAYQHLPELGGRRSRQRAIPLELNAFWQNASFHNFADYALSEPFRTGLERLRELGRSRRCAIMCSETLWWHCHRRIITDYLLAAGESVFHILGPQSVVPATMTPEARPENAGGVLYPA
jgi:uncharacterized protein (DUF488 family)